MPRFRYALQFALDDALAREGAAEFALSSARSMLVQRQRRVAEITSLAVAARAQLSGEKPLPANLYVEVGLRLTAIGKAAHEFRAGAVASEREVLVARDALDVLMRRRTAIERHRNVRRERFAAAADLREAAECDETNAVRRAPAWV